MNCAPHYILLYYALNCFECHLWMRAVLLLSNILNSQCPNTALWWFLRLEIIALLRTLLYPVVLLVFFFSNWKKILKAKEKSIFEQMLKGIYWDSGTPPAATLRVLCSHYCCREEGSFAHWCSQIDKIWWASATPCHGISCHHMRQVSPVHVPRGFWHRGCWLN